MLLRPFAPLCLSCGLETVMVLKVLYDVCLAYGYGDVNQEEKDGGRKKNGTVDISSGGKSSKSCSC